jgi:hypothetical protein
VSNDKAVNDVDKDHWVKAMESELESMYSNKVWTLLKVPNVIKLLVVNGFTRERRENV